ncbi:hypothetical protein AHAS_Ahas02G0138100 [Arachis hypogaea]
MMIPNMIFMQVTKGCPKQTCFFNEMDTRLIGKSHNHSRCLHGVGPSARDLAPLS